ncbi:alpha/beta hydrolase fold domain-containing protein [Nocardia niwae]|uniref:Alpha/beta hydrolase fold domain-containing protein n=1 Tax=Nocardia niwae TaxID=626084 RepID=A0ABV2X723_9NOCA
MIVGTRHLEVDTYLEYVADSGAEVASIEYRLAPEHPDPAPITDCYTGLRWCAEHFDALAIDPTRIIVAGDSAGGGLAAGVAPLARDRAFPIGRSSAAATYDEVRPSGRRARRAAGRLRNCMDKCPYNCLNSGRGPGIAGLADPQVRGLLQRLRHGDPGRSRGVPLLPAHLPGPVRTVKRHEPRGRALADRPRRGRPFARHGRTRLGRDRQRLLRGHPRYPPRPVFGGQGRG